MEVRVNDVSAPISLIVVSYSVLTSEKSDSSIIDAGVSIPAIAPMEMTIDAFISVVSFITKSTVTSFS